MNGDKVGPASTTYHDWIGTVALDKPDPNHESIYDLAGLDGGPRAG